MFQGQDYNLEIAVDRLTHSVIDGSLRMEDLGVTILVEFLPQRS